MAWAVRCTDDFDRLQWPSGMSFGACSECGDEWPYIVTGFYASNVECFDAIAVHVAAEHAGGAYVGRAVPDATRREGGWTDARGRARPDGRPSPEVDGQSEDPRHGSS